MMDRKALEKMRHALITAAVPLKPRVKGNPRTVEDLERICASQVSLAQEALDILNAHMPTPPMSRGSKKDG